MKIVWQSLLGAAIIHILYFAAAMSVGYVKTITYKPNFSAAWKHADNLQSTVAFGSSTSPLWYTGTFLGAAIVCGLLLIGYKKLTTQPLHTEKF